MSSQRTPQTGRTGKPGYAKLTAGFVAEVMCHLSGAEVKVYVALLSHAPRIEPGQPRLCRLTGLARSTLNTALNRLEKWGLIERTRRLDTGKTTRYQAADLDDEAVQRAVLTRMGESDVPDTGRPAERTPPVQCGGHPGVRCAGPEEDNIEEDKVKKTKEEEAGRPASSSFSSDEAQIDDDKASECKDDPSTPTTLHRVEHDTPAPPFDAPSQDDHQLATTIDTTTDYTNSTNHTDNSNTDNTTDYTMTTTDYTTTPRPDACATDAGAPGDMPATASPRALDGADDESDLRQLLQDPDQAGIADTGRLAEALAACRTHGWTPAELRQLIAKARREATSPRGPGGLVLAMLRRGREKGRRADAPASPAYSECAASVVRDALAALGIEDPTREQLVHQFTPTLEKLRKSTLHGKSAVKMLHWALTEADPSDTVDPDSKKIGVKINLIRRHLGAYAQKAEFEALCAELGYDEAMRRRQAAGEGVERNFGNSKVSETMNGG